MKRYDSLNGLRTIACLSIILMHIVSNLNFKFEHKIINTSISSLTNFVFLFFMISSFSMCCGYYKKFKNQEISICDFYKKRFAKIIPIFSFLVIIDVLIEKNLSSLIEGFADMTLLYGYLPNRIEVIGVGWFIGIIVLFYLMFPFFTYIISTKKKTLKYLFISILMNVCCIYYFKVDRTNMFYSFLYLMLGGTIYKYRNNLIPLCKRNKNILKFICILLLAIFLISSSNEYILNLEISIVFVFWMLYAISFDSKALNNKVTNFISKISLEMYLSHMFLFRIINKLEFENHITNRYINLLIYVIMVISLTIIFSLTFRYFYNRIYEKVKKNANTIS